MIAKDSSNNNFQLTVLGNTEINTSIKKFGTGSAYFDGNDLLLIPDNEAFNFGSDNFTVEGWYYPTSITAQMHFMGQWSGALDGGISWILVSSNDTNGNLRLIISSTGNNIVFDQTFGTTISPNQWSHIALVRNGNVFTVYLNGTLVGTVTNSAALHNASNPLSLGGNTNGVNYYTGYVDDFRITKGIARYTSNFTPPIAELIDPSDPYIDNVSLLLHGDGSNNSLLITDSSNNNFAVALNGDAKISQTEKKFGTGSIALDGNGDYLSTTQVSLGTDDFTLECWVYPTSLPSQSSIFNQGDSDSAGNFIVNIKSNNKLSLWADSNERYNSTASISLNTWTHLAITRQNGIYYFFINGNLDGTYSGSHNHTGSPFKIGHGYGGITYFNGYIDEARITKGIARYTSNFIPPTTPFSNRIVSDTVPTAGLVARFMADQGVTESGGVITSWVDQSGNNIVATPFGNPTRIANQMNGRPAVSFNDTQYFSFNLNATIIGPHTYVILGRYRDPTSTGQQGFLAAGLDGSYDRGYVFKNGSEDRAYFYNGAQIRSPNITLAKYHVATVVHNGINGYNNYRMNGNNSTEISYSAMNVASVNQFVIGGRFLGSELMRGEIVEILIYNRQLSMIEIEQIEKYAKV